MDFDALYAWAREARAPSFLHRRSGGSIQERIERTSSRAGLGKDGFARLTASADQSFWRELDAAELPADLARKDSVYLVITNRCNNGAAYRDADGEVRHRTCGHCLNGSGPNGVSMSERDLERTIANLPFPLREVELSGGEPLMPQNMPLTLRAVRLCAERYGPDLMLSLQTNGDFLLSPKRCAETMERLRQNGLRRIAVASMDIYHGRGGSDQERFEERKRHYARIAENLRRVRGVELRSGGYQEPAADPNGVAAHFFGADIQNRFRGFHIDHLAPNARAVRTGLASERENGAVYCARHSGARGFLGSAEDDQIAVNGGFAYPCCWFTEYPLADVRKGPISKTLLAYALDPLALALHLGEPRRAHEALAAAYPELSDAFRELSEETAGLNECSACRRFTRRYSETMQKANPALYARLWRDLDPPWDHRTDGEANAVFESWANRETRREAALTSD